VSNGEFKAGELIPGTRYRVLGLLGSGGMGTVYEVEHTELGKRFVLKMLLRELALREDLVARLRNEQRALGRLEHPSIVTVTDAGITTTNVPYFVMERLDGETLGARLKRSGYLPLKNTIEIAAAVLDGLAAAHEIGVVHRDIKPQNIFLASGLRPKILDFGVAKIADTGGAITARGVAVGTPRYMSPEQASGERVDGRSDLYAVGLLVYESAIGKGPFDDARDANEMLLAHLSRPVPRLSARLGSVTRELDDFVLSLLAKDPSQRPSSARAAADGLRTVGRPYADAPASVPHSLTVRMSPSEPAPTTHADGVAARRAWGLHEGTTEDAKTLARVERALGPNDTLIDEPGAAGVVPLTGDVSTLKDFGGGGPTTRTEILSVVEPAWPGETHTRVPVTPTDGSRTLDPVPLARLPKASGKGWGRGLRAAALMVVLVGGVLGLGRALAHVFASAKPDVRADAPNAAARPALHVVAQPSAVAVAPDPNRAVAPPPAGPSAAPASPPEKSAAPPVAISRKPARKARSSPRPPKIPDGLPGSGL